MLIVEIKSITHKDNLIVNKYQSFLVKVVIQRKTTNKELIHNRIRIIRKDICQKKIDMLDHVIIKTTTHKKELITHKNTKEKNT